jgi:hypothetical protein
VTKSHGRPNALLFVLALCVSTCGPTTMDRLSSLKAGASRKEVVGILGPSLPESQWPSGVSKLPDGCASQLLYRDEYVRGYSRVVARMKTCGGSWLHVCFDERGRYMPGVRFTMVTC